MKYQVQFKDYDVWEDFLDTEDNHDGLYNTEWEAEEAIDYALIRYPLTHFVFEAR